MKLWLKISLIAIIMTAIAASVCSLLLLIDSGNANLDTAVNNTLSSLQMRAGSWQITFDAASDGSFDDTSERSLAKFLMSSLSGTKSALTLDGELIYNATGIDPRDYLTVENGSTQYVIEDIDGYSILISGKYVYTNMSAYVMYQMEDLTRIYDDIRTTAFRFAAISLSVVGVVGLLTIILVRFLLRPVSKLKESAALIAAGVYDKRIGIAGQDEIGELAGDFNKMADAVQAHVTELSDEAERRTLLMSALAHELRTPLTSISGNAQTLLYTKLTEDEREQALRTIDGECARVERLSQKLMRLIVLRQSDSIQLDEHSADGFLDRVSAAYAPVLAGEGMNLIVENHMDTLYMDDDLLASLLINLLDNARKASRAGDTIAITAKGDTISVTDHGAGIPPDALPQVTQPFFMADKSRSRAAGGMGLGLALADEIARLHGAVLVFESTVGRGTSVKVVFKNA